MIISTVLYMYANEICFITNTGCSWYLKYVLGSTRKVLANPKFVDHCKHASILFHAGQGKEDAALSVTGSSREINSVKRKDAWKDVSFCCLSVIVVDVWLCI